jgi:hypothetical protein
MKISDEIRGLSPTQRRRFLKLMGFALGGVGVPAALRFAFNDMALGGKEAHAQTASEGTIFLEYDFRDQVDLMHVFVPPGIATYQNLMRGVNGAETALFYGPAEIKKVSETQYLTPDSLELEPHVADIAIIDTGEAAIGGVHGHEGGNGMRSPGRLMDGGASGKMPMWLADGEHAAGSEELYTTTPTPSTIHNYYQKTLNPGMHNGYAFKGISRAKHSVYHFKASLPDGELDRIKSKEDLVATFPAVVADASMIPSAGEAELLVTMLKQADTRLFNRRYAAEAGVSHLQQLSQSRQILHVDNPTVVSVPLTEEEIAHWKTGIPNQQCTEGDTIAKECGADASSAVGGGHVKAQIWEQFGHATKILGTGATRTAALEFDFMDLHGDGVRVESVLQTQAHQSARPLARAIQHFKDLGLWHRTLIAIYTLDGSREPKANSYGDRGKGTIILAGGMIKGGYYGDIRPIKDLASGHDFGFVVADPVTGTPTGEVVSSWGDKSKRTPSADIWLTVVKALGIPDDVARQFPDVANGKTLDYLLKTPIV